MLNYKEMYEHSERLRADEAIIAEGKIRLWKAAYMALLKATNGTAADWKRSHAALLDIVSDLEEDVSMYEMMLKKRDEIEQNAMKRSADEILKHVDTALNGLRLTEPKG